MAPRTIPGLLAFGAETFGDHPAIVDGDVTISYADLARRVNEASRGFLAAGVVPGDRVAIWAPNRYEFIIALLAAENIGAAMVPLNTRYRGQEARTILERSRAAVLVTSNGFLGADYVSMLEESGEPLPSLKTVVNLGPTPHPHALDWDAFLAAGAAVTPERLAEVQAEVTEETVADILFTSGTTGVPKGVMSAQRQTVGVADVWARGATLTPADRYLVVNPLFHSFGYKAGVMAAFTAGSTVYLQATFDPVQAMEIIGREHITVFPGAPTIFITLLNHERRSEFDLSSLRFSIAGAASVPENLFQQMRDDLGIDQVAQAYGLTECVVATQSRPHEDPLHIAETTGPAVPGLEIRTVGADGADVAMGEDGEIWIRGDNVMLGYFEDPKSTAETIDAEGWLHTGDVGRLDEHGCLKITDRIKDMFTVGGFNVYPAEVENVIASHPDVMETAVIGIDDERMGSVGRAYVVPRPGHEVSAEALTAYCRERLANFKVPRELVVLTEFPRNASGKILKKDLA
ncbi:AMP-binding protein [Nocardioides sp.]|uniref:AMP-binding protein n=1 Tax=Nocardioides sp. TaxID=35761 RepID=UPI00260AA406|nr:AMP-binding protein [Nocardioides sp.]